MRKTLPFLLLAALPASFLACKSSKEELLPETPDQYLNLQPGKYIIYRLDSTVYTNSGRTTEWHSYQERQLVDTIVTDGLGRPSWRIFRSIRPANGNGPWTPGGTFLITLANGAYEVQEDNMRMLRLVTPVREGFSWRGNQFVGPDPYLSLYDFDNDNNIQDWNYTISAANRDTTINGQSYSNVATVDLVNEQLLPDTLDVANNSVQIPTGTNFVWMRGNATATISINPPATPPPGRLLSVYNYSNRTAVLAGIEVPATMGRTYEYLNGNWTYGNGEDTLLSAPPYGFRSFARDRYARGIGLITQEYILYQYEPNPNGTPFTKGFGVKRTILEHN